MRLALFLPVTRLAFRIDLAQLLLLVATSAVIDVGADWSRFGPDPRFSWLGAGGEIFGTGVLLLCAAALALLFRQQALSLAIPVLALASYPIVQLLQVAPHAIPDSESWAASAPAGAYKTAMIAWSIAVLVRSVAVALVPAGPRPWLRALAGGLMLAVPITLAPLLIAYDAWWQASSAPVDGRYPNPASEPVLATQQVLLDDALANLDDETPGETDLYFVGFASDARDDAYLQDMQAARRAMDERWDMRDRSVVLINSPATLLDTPMATVTHLRETLKEIALAINVEEDVVMLYLAGPSAADGALAVALPPLELLPLTPAALRALLEESGIIWRIVVVSSCNSGAFAEALKDDTTLVMTTTGDDKTGGCAVTNGSTRLGAALFAEALSRGDSLQRAFEAAQAAPESGSAGGAQLFVGKDMEQKLKELDRVRTKRNTGRTV